jgi:hypothetical protein
MRKFLLLLSILFIASFVFFTPVLGQTGNGLKNKQSIENKLKEMEGRRKANIASRAADKKAKLDAKKLKVCETKQRNITRRSQAAAARAANQFRVFGSITDKVDKFYTEKVLARGITVASYSALKDDILANKTLAEASVNNASASAATIDCNSENPKGQIQTFREDMKEVISALKNYRTSVRNFIVAVKSAIGKNQSASNSAGGDD